MKYKILQLVKTAFWALPFILGIQHTNAMEEIDQNNSLLSLPGTALSQIIDDVEFEDLCRLKMVCHRLNELASDTKERLWKGYYPYPREFDFDSMDDPIWTDYPTWF